MACTDGGGASVRDLASSMPAVSRLPHGYPLGGETPPGILVPDLLRLATASSGFQRQVRRNSGTATSGNDIK